jgi:hypothetical protein
MASANKHFDCLKNKLPDNWTNSNASGYYNRAFWKRCKCEYGTTNPCKNTADKWNPVATEPSKWTNGCSPCDNYYNEPRNYYYSYNSNDCGDGKKWIHWDKCNPCKPCNPCDPCEKICADKCGKPVCDSTFQAVYKTDGCNDCKDVAIVYRVCNEEEDCDNIVELKIPTGGSKEMYMTRFSPEFIYANRFQCATVPAYNYCDENVIDNRREMEFTVSDQNALVKRGINNSITAKKLYDDGKIVNKKFSHQIPMNVVGRTSYYYFGDIINTGSTMTGLYKDDVIKGYFAGCNC